MCVCILFIYYIFTCSFLQLFSLFFFVQSLLCWRESWAEQSSGGHAPCSVKWHVSTKLRQITSSWLANLSLTTMDYSGVCMGVCVRWGLEWGLHGCVWVGSGRQAGFWLVHTHTHTKKLRWLIWHRGAEEVTNQYKTWWESGLWPIMTHKTQAHSSLCKRPHVYTNAHTKHWNLSKGPHIAYAIKPPWVILRRRSTLTTSLCWWCLRYWLAASDP